MKSGVAVATRDRSGVALAVRQAKSGVALAVRGVKSGLAVVALAITADCGCGTAEPRVSGLTGWFIILSELVSLTRLKRVWGSS